MGSSMIGTCEESRYIPFRWGEGGGGGGGVIQTLDKGGGCRSQEKFFSALQASVWSKNRGGPSPGSTVVSKKYPVLIFQRLTRC